MIPAAGPGDLIEPFIVRCQWLRPWQLQSSTDVYHPMLNMLVEVREGTVTAQRSDSSRYDLRPGSVVLCEPGTRLFFSRRAHTSLIAFDLLPRQRGPQPRHWRDDNDDRPSPAVRTVLPGIPDPLPEAVCNAAGPIITAIHGGWWRSSLGLMAANAHLALWLHEVASGWHLMDVPTRLRQVIRERLPYQPSVAMLAAALGISVSTLERACRAAGSTPRSIMDEVRWEQLGDPLRLDAPKAHLLGFADVDSCRRWLRRNIQAADDAGA